jgi:hypothetical protein
MTPAEVRTLRLDELYAFERSMREDLEARAQAIRRASRRRR